MSDDSERVVCLHRWMVYGSFAKGSSGWGTLAAFDVESAEKCDCAELEDGGDSLRLCTDWTAEFISRMYHHNIHPRTIFLHWHHRHLVLVGPLLNSKAAAVADSTADDLELQTKSKILYLPADADHVSDSLDFSVGTESDSSSQEDTDHI